MYEYFHGWRRKVGWATLLAAMVATLGWIRSSVIEDCVVVVRSSRCVTLVASRSRVAFVTTTFAPMGAIWDSSPLSDSDMVLETEMLDPGRAIWTVPYWPVVLFLTLFAGYLIVAPSRKQRH